MASRVLVIDDLRVFKPDWERHTDVTYARTPNEGVNLLKPDHWDIVVLDHDMGIDYNTGEFLDIWPVVKVLEEQHEDFANLEVWIVTSNPVAGQRMANALESKYDVFVLGEGEKSNLFTYLDW